MKEIPILFSAPMVQAIISFLKGMTRRTRGLEKINIDPSAYYLQTLFLHATGRFTFAPRDPMHAITDADIIEVKCPYGQPGDLLWVRETYLKPPFITQKLLREGADTWPKFDYKASCDEYEIEQYKEWDWQIKPSIHMPKAAARIWLQVVEIRVERLHDISEDNARREGVKFASSTIGPCYLDYINGGYNAMTTAYHSFRSLWRKINGNKSWDLNPWVWVIEFKILSTTGKPELATCNTQPESIKI